jgi:diphthamide biosynthesis protein 7
MDTDTEGHVEYTTRLVEQEVDTVVIVPEHSEYMVVGTYSLVKKDDDAARDHEAQTRRGTIQVMTVSPTFQPTYAGMLPPRLDRRDFASAVLDMHFHPTDKSLLGVATSRARIHLFRFTKHGDVLGRRVVTRLLPLGVVVTVADHDRHGLVPLITQFCWFPETHTRGVAGVDDVQDVSLAATTSSGETIIIHTTVPAIRDLHDGRLVDRSDTELPVTSTEIHKHDLEAWCVAFVTLDRGPSALRRIILGGGDDSALIASVVDVPDTNTSDPGSPSISPSDVPDIVTHPLWKDRRTHTAGVVSILPLPAMTVPGADGLGQTLPLVTGSYDEFLRVYEIDPQTYPHRATFKGELRLAGGVWRLKVLDQYTTPGSVGSTTAERTEPTTSARATQHHTLVLASLMHGGVAILRLTYATAAGASGASDATLNMSWTITPLLTFRAGHESMVYCCDARREEPDQDAPKYTIVSTSFYDMKVCTWEFVDHFKGQHRLLEGGQIAT